MPQRPRVAIWPALGEGASLSSGRQGFDTIHFIFPTTENWIKAALAQGEGRREEAASPWPTHHPPPSPWASRPGPLRVGGQGGGVWMGARLTARVSFRLAWGGGRGRTRALANCPLQSMGVGALPGCCPHFWAEPGAPSANSQAVRAHMGQALSSQRRPRSGSKWAWGCPVPAPTRPLARHLVDVGPQRAGCGREDTGNQVTYPHPVHLQGARKQARDTPGPAFPTTSPTLGAKMSPLRSAGHHCGP